MLDGAFTSPKIRRLAAVLGVPWPHALGLAGLLWRFTAKHAPTGEIGLHDDEEIAAPLNSICVNLAEELSQGTQEEPPLPSLSVL